MLKKLLEIILSLIVVVTGTAAGVSAFTDEVYAESIGNSVLESFIADSRWSDGASYAWNQGPKLASFSSQGCCAYCADYVKYCYERNNPRSGSVFYSVNDIAAGDVLTVGNQSDGTGHWFVCLKRDGNRLYVAEGNYNNKVRIGWNYTISGSKFAEDSRSFTAGYHYYPSITPPAKPADTNVKISSASVKVEDITYSGKELSPKVTVKIGSKVLEKNKDYKVKYSNNKKIGTGKVSVTGIGKYTGKTTKSFKILPKKTSVLKVTSGSSAFTVKWKKVEGCTGYQIRYSEKSSMEGSKYKSVSSRKKVEKKITDLKKFRVYYVQVRTYKTVDDKKYYSKWSSKSTVGTKSSKAGYSIVKKDHSGNVSGRHVKCYYKYPVFSGNTSAIQKINKSIKNEYKKFVDGGSIDGGSIESVYGYANIDGYQEYNDEYLNTVDCKVTYNDKYVVCIAYTTGWYAGGVYNSDKYGSVYSLKTGKRLYIDDVCKGSSSEIKSSIASKMKQKKNELWGSAITDMKKMKIEKIHFYIMPKNKCIVCFGPYEVGAGGSYRTFTIKSKYK